MILDTNVVSELTKRNPNADVRDFVRSVSRAEFFITSVTLAELLYGIALLPAGRRRNELQTVQETFFAVELGNPVLSFEDSDAPHYAEIVARRRALGRPIRELDAQIAAIARRRALLVVTRNMRDFDDCGIGLINPWEPRS
jgi:predicted nucleic acid-binding protein